MIISAKEGNKTGKGYGKCVVVVMAWFPIFGKGLREVVMEDLTFE